MDEQRQHESHANRGNRDVVVSPGYTVAPGVHCPIKGCIVAPRERANGEEAVVGGSSMPNLKRKYTPGYRQFAVDSDGARAEHQKCWTAERRRSSRAGHSALAPPVRRSGLRPRTANTPAGYKVLRTGGIDGASGCAKTAFGHLGHPPLARASVIGFGQTPAKPPRAKVRMTEDHENAFAHGTCRVARRQRPNCAVLTSLFYLLAVKFPDLTR
jgi:hypothetical protein